MLKNENYIDDIYKRITEEEQCIVSIGYKCGTITTRGLIEIFEFDNGNLFFNIGQFNVEFEDCKEICMEYTFDGIMYIFKFFDIQIYMMFLD